MEEKLKGLDEIKKEVFDPEVSEIKKEPIYEQKGEIKQEQSNEQLIGIKKEIFDGQITNIKQEISDILVKDIKKEEGSSQLNETIEEDIKPSINTADKESNGIHIELSEEVENKVTITVTMNEDKYIYEGFVQDLGKKEMYMKKLPSRKDLNIKEEERSIKLSDENVNRIKAWLEYGMFQSVGHIQEEVDFPAQNRDEETVQPSTSSSVEESSPPIPRSSASTFKYGIEIFEHEIEEMMRKTCNRNMVRVMCSRVMNDEERAKQDKNNLAARRSRAKAKILYIKLKALENARILEEANENNDDNHDEEDDDDCCKKKKSKTCE